MPACTPTSDCTLPRATSTRLMRCWGTSRTSAATPRPSLVCGCKTSIHVTWTDVSAFCALETLLHSPTSAMHVQQHLQAKPALVAYVARVRKEFF